MKLRRACFLVLLPLFVRDLSAHAAAATENGAHETTAIDPLADDVRRVVEKVEGIRGEKGSLVLLASRATAEAREAAVAATVATEMSREQLDARGRAWSDVGIGDREAPLRLLRRLAADLEVVQLDPTGSRLLVGENVLSDRDFLPEQPDDPASAVLLATGVRPDEPLIAHMVVHAWERSQVRNAARAALTTDALVTRSAWAEGAANLVAIGMLFQGLRLADAVLRPGINPGEVLDGRLVPAGIDASPMPDRAFLEFVYEDGYDQAVRAFRAGGFRALEQAARGRTTARDVLHSERAPLPPPEVPEVVAPRNGETSYRLADTDTLGEQGIFALVSHRTGKDDLALAAGDGWRSDRLLRWEPVSNASGLKGITVWESFWGSDEDAAEFAYALGRAFEDGWGAVAQAGPPAQPLRWSTPERVFRLVRAGRSVTLRVAPAADDAFLEAAGKKSAASSPAKKINK